MGPSLHQRQRRSGASVRSLRTAGWRSALFRLLLNSLNDCVNSLNVRVNYQVTEPMTHSLPMTHPLTLAHAESLLGGTDTLSSPVGEQRAADVGSACAYLGTRA